MVRLVEQASLAERPARIDREGGVLRGIRLLNPRSRNGRRYLPEAIAAARGKYEGIKVYYDHAAAPGQSRGIRDQAGWVRHVTRAANGGLEGDLHFFKSDPLSAKVLEAAERRPEQLGFSHEVEATTEQRGGETVVTAILEVFSVNLVAEPASTRSLFEGRLKEQNAMDDSAQARIKAAFLDAVQKVVEDYTLEPAEAAGRVKALLEARQKALASASDADAAVTAALAGLKAQPGTSPAAEAWRRKAAGPGLREAAPAWPSQISPEEIGEFVRAIRA